ncbi:DUF2064 domain-containing protein [Maribacter sp. MAR_2009_72]|uniref:TIGR04282 family arsenosugar biosynthesis glycosyltransferase n=1 Tax=Maribacter sp. MAR_2009_72 TaxID=1250050 RepID=UPI0011992FA2|nr:DUF2064 domain-containing protein [Maribacter sp. MAR_2009_72]TVZ16196.1 hypothetical protein JM81_2451 [Maribacter sp. MAR_2009_72]
MNALNSTAILLFANSSRQELVCKSIVRSEKLFDILTQVTLGKARRTGLPVFHFTEKEQIGSNFGERFTNAMTAIYDIGFHNIIVIGNDTPQLTTQHLTYTAKQLAIGKPVIGGSIDGGFYLLGLQRVNFDSNDLKNLPWQRFGLFNQISLSLKKKSLEVVLLPVLQDLDTEKDLKSILSFSYSLSTTLLLLILSILRNIEHLYYTLHNYIDSYATRCYFNKGSPANSFIPIPLYPTVG